MILNGPGFRSATEPDPVPWVAARAPEALLKEVLRTPKPGLVDRRDPSAYRDLDLQTFLNSAGALSTWFPRFAATGASRALVSAHGVRAAGLPWRAARLPASLPRRAAR